MLRFRMTAIPRADGVRPRAVRLALMGRFADELSYGAVDVLTPTLRAALGLSYAQVSLLLVALDYVAAAVEPVNGLLTDLYRRKWLLAWGAAGVGVATATIGLAPTFGVLLLAFALYGAASGPLAHTADIVLVEMHPRAPGRIFARATALDTVGALLAPLSIAAAFWLDVSWRWVLVGIGACGVLYAAALISTEFPAPAAEREGRDRRNGRALAEAGRNLRAVLSDRDARFWLVLLRAFSLLEAPTAFHAIWLAEAGGMSQALVGVYMAFAMGVNLCGVLYLDRWLGTASPRRIVLTVTPAVLLLYPLWFLVGSTLLRFAVAVPLNFLFAALWPIARSESLRAAAGKPGALDAVNSLAGLLPVTLGIGLLAERIGLTPALLGVHVLGAGLVLLIAWRWMPAHAGALGTKEAV